MAGKKEDLLWKLAESDEVDIETRRDGKSPVHRTTIWIVPVQAGVYVRSFKGKKACWYQEALANPRVTIRVGRREVGALADIGMNRSGIRAVSAGYREKYGEGWPAATAAIHRRSVMPTP